MNRIDFRGLINTFIAQLLTMSIRNNFIFLRDLFLNRITNNYFFRVIAITLGVNINTLIDTKPKKFFWLGFTFTLILYKQFMLFKRLILWPFKLGIFSFIFSIFGVDPNWFLGWFDLFSFNIPQWVYIQYLNLYNNWISWWKNTAEIKNLKTESLPSIPKNKYDGLTEVETDNPDNKWFSKKNIIIGVTVIALIGVGIWYFYYSGNGAGNTNAGGGNGGGGNLNPILTPNPPAPNTNPIPHQITIMDNQTPTSSAEPGTVYDPTNNNLINRIERLKNTGVISNGEYNQLREALEPSSSSNPNLNASTQSEAVQSILDLDRRDRIGQLRTDRLENILTQENLNAPSSNSTSPTEGQTVVPTIEVIPATPVDTPVDQPNLNPSDIERPISPSGSTDSTETVRPYAYGDPGDTRYAIPRRNFNDPVFRRRD